MRAPFGGIEGGRGKVDWSLVSFASVEVGGGVGDMRTPDVRGVEFWRVGGIGGASSGGVPSSSKCVLGAGELLPVLGKVFTGSGCGEGKGGEVGKSGGERASSHEEGSDWVRASLACGVTRGCSMTVLTCEVDAATALLNVCN